MRLAIVFSEAFAAEKRRKNLVDFHDLEHFALEILVDAKTKQARAAAEEFRDMYEEIMIDEYQDSNHVQETLLRAISREERGAYNLFMVGDVKRKYLPLPSGETGAFYGKKIRYLTRWRKAVRSASICTGISGAGQRCLIDKRCITGSWRAISAMWHTMRMRRSTRARRLLCAG